MELNLISDFEAAVNCLQNPSLTSQILLIPALSKASQFYSFCKWGALVIAILAAFCGLVASIKFLILKISRIKIIPSSAVNSIKLLSEDDFDSDSDDDVDDDTRSSISSEDDEEEYEERAGFSDGEFTVAGEFGRRFSWSDFAAGRSVVRLWDNLTSGFDIDEDQLDGVVSIWDFSGEKCGAPAVVLSAEKVDNGGVLLGLYDDRVRRGSPETTAEWPWLRRRAAAGVSAGGVEQVYVRDDATGALTVGDLRNVKSPLDTNAVTMYDSFGVRYR